MAGNPGPDRDEGLAELLSEVRRIDVQARRLVANLIAGEYSSVFRGSGLEFEGVREYEEGDDPRSVDWNVTARIGRPFVKKYRDEREQTVLFLLDLSSSMDGGFSAWSARQVAARILACLALSAIRNNDQVGLVAFSRGVDRYVPPGKGVGHVLRIVRDCLALEGSSPETDLIPALEFTSRVVRRRAICFLVSDFLTEGWSDALALLARRHDLIAIHLLTLELAPPAGAGGPADLLRLRDPETGRHSVVDAGSPRVRAAWNERIAAWRGRVRTNLVRAKVDRMDVLVPRRKDPEALARPILEFFRMRELRGAKR